MSNVNQIETQKPVSTWRKVVAAILDFFTIMFIAGYAIGYLTGNLTEEGFNLKGGPAFLLFAIIVLYFVIFSRFLGGTLWQRLLGAR
jgi:magnesium-transporting ATPase (P-type)